MSVEDHVVSFSLEVNVEKAYEDIRRIETVAYRALSLLQQSGLLPEDRAKTLEMIQRAITLANQARLMIIALQTAAGPIGWAMAGISVITTMVSTSDFVMEVEGR